MKNTENVSVMRTVAQCKTISSSDLTPYLD